MSHEAALVAATCGNTSIGSNACGSKHASIGSKRATTTSVGSNKGETTTNRRVWQLQACGSSCKLVAASMSASERGAVR